jgi:hypothetical protein
MAVPRPVAPERPEGLCSEKGKGPRPEMDPGVRGRGADIVAS